MDEKPVKHILPKIVRQFIETESASGIVMILFAVLALCAANSGFYYSYKAFISADISFSFGEHVASAHLKEWVKDILMVFFFLVVGLELKREMCEGFLTEKSQVILPLAAALGGMVVPAIVYLGLNMSVPENHAGWAIPSATDIAFALCVLMLVGKSVPSSVKIFLLAIAIFDDLGAILIIAAFYNTALAPIPLALAAAGLVGLWLLNRANITTLAPYFLLGIYLWFCFYHSGIHTTVAGVVVGMAIPMRNKLNPRHSPVNGMIHFMHPWVSFLVLPIFAFTSAGISFADIAAEDIFNPLPLGIALGLFVGKQIGIFGTTWALIKMKFARAPEGANWLHIYGVSIIAGIGFTMSLFIGMLAFPGEHQQEFVKIGVIGGSLLSTLWGYAILRLAAKRTSA